MNFRIKSLLQNIFCLTPKAESLNYFMQCYISRNMPPSEAHYLTKWNGCKNHYDKFMKYVDKADAVCYEIGSGWELSNALFFATMPFSKIYAVDVERHARPKLLNHSVNLMHKYNYLDEKVIFTRENYNTILAEKFPIEYLAPMDARKTNFGKGTIDLIVSDNVFEHISEDVLRDILIECNRVVSNNGIMSLFIDYSDHYIWVDKKITPYNLLKYSDKDWKWYNNTLHYVNRLRHKDFVRLFTQCGFEIVEEEQYWPDNASELLNEFSFHKQFLDRYTYDELRTTGASFILRKK